MTLGEVYVHFDALAEYLKMTNPWGSGEDEKTKRRDNVEFPHKKHYEDLDVAQRIVGQGFAHPALNIRHISEIEDDLKDLIPALLPEPKKA